jgi:hypothetical protein
MADAPPMLLGLARIAQVCDSMAAAPPAGDREDRTPGSPYVSCYQTLLADRAPH